MDRSRESVKYNFANPPHDPRRHATHNIVDGIIRPWHGIVIMESGMSLFDRFMDVLDDKSDAQFLRVLLEKTEKTLMPVYTFDSFEEARHALWEFNPGPEYYRRVARLFDLAFRIAPLRCRRGIRAYASIEEAQKDRFHSQTGLRAP